MFYSRKTVRPAQIIDDTCKESRLCATAALLAFFILPVNALAALDLDETVRLALVDDPAIKAMQTRASAISDTAVANGQLPDPKLKTGLYNLPVDDFDIDREPTTQFRLGLVQAFPRGDTLQYKQQQTEWMAQAEKAKSEITERKLVRDVRKHFLELYYQVQAEQVVRESRKLFAQLVDITQAHYANGRVSQQDVLRASLELSRLDDRTTRILNEADKGRAALTKWIGDAALLPIDDPFPELPTLPSKAEITTALPEHPLIRTETAKLEASKRKIRIAGEQYKPGWSAGLEYRKRFGDDPDGDSRADMMAAMVTVDLPMFTKNRQDKRLSASVQMAESAQLTRDDRLRELKLMLDTDYANWSRLGERAAIYDGELVRDAAANVQASLKAYQSGITEFTTLMRARITDLDVRLQDLRIRVDRAKSQANLLYIAGEIQ
jgi:outer membrane protein TolC